MAGMARLRVLFLNEGELGPGVMGHAPVEAAEREPRSAAVRLYLGRAYLEAGRFADAEAQLLEAQKLFPGDEEIADALDRTL